MGSGPFGFPTPVPAPPTSKTASGGSAAPSRASDAVTSGSGRSATCPTPDGRSATCPAPDGSRAGDTASPASDVASGGGQAPATPDALDPSLADPLHEQLASILRRKVLDGTWRRGSYIPSESDLMARYHVSRGTVRRAIATLTSEGLLLPRKGRGTLVGTGLMSRPAVGRSFSFAASLAESGRAYETRVLAHEVVPAPAEVARRLGLHEGDEALFTRRVRSVDGHPVVCQESWESVPACPGIEDADLARESMFDAVERCSGKRVALSRSHCLPRLAGTEHGGYLGCDPAAPVIVLEQVIGLADGTPCEWSLTWLAPNQSLVGTSWQEDALHGPLDLDDLAHADSSSGRGPEGPESQSERRRLELAANDVRRGVLRIGHMRPEMSLHYGGCLSMAEIVAVLFGAVLHTGRDGTPWERRDRLVLSKAHASVALYPALEQAGLVTHDDLERGLLGPDAVLFRHPQRDPARGLEMSGGSLGMGPGYAVGLAIALRRRHLPGRVFCIVGDGECDEGSVWEACALAGHVPLDNLTIVVDANGLQLDGPTREVLYDGPLARKFAAFGFDAEEVDGHDVLALEAALRRRGSRPRAVVARTVKGKGVAAAEGNVAWHDIALEEDAYREAMAGLDAQREALADA